MLKFASGMGGQKKSIYYGDLVKALNFAATDDQVLGLVTTMGKETGLGLATTEEVRNAVKAFGAVKEKKFSAIHAKSFGNVLDSGLKTYYLASAFQHIAMRPTGEVNLGGLKISTPFFGKLLSKIGIEAEFDQRGIYKGYVDQFSSDRYSDGTRRSLSNILTGIEGELVKSIAESRGMTEEQFKKHMDQEFFLGFEALQNKIVGFLAHEDHVLGSAVQQVAKTLFKSLKDTSAATYNHKLEGESATTTTDGKPESADGTDSDKSIKVKTLEMQHYIKARRLAVKAIRVPTEAALTTLLSQDSAKKAVAEGTKVVGVVELNASFDVKEVQKQFKLVRDAAAIGAVVFRVNSPGGEVQKFETIAHEVVKTKKAGKPVIVSMGDVAASGGYLVAAPATRIFAMPQTITGSIGVAAGKFALDGLMETVGVSGDSIHADFSGSEHENPLALKPEPGRTPDPATMFTKMTPAQKANFSRSLDSSYAWFKAQVAGARRMSHAKVESVAQGRVWTGRQALANGLVDEIGSLDDAIQHAKKELGELEAPHLFIEASFGQQLERYFSDSYSSAAFAKAVASAVMDQQPHDSSSPRIVAKLPEVEHIK